MPNIGGLTYIRVGAELKLRPGVPSGISWKREDAAWHLNPANFDHSQKFEGITKSPNQEDLAKPAEVESFSIYLVETKAAWKTF